MRTPEYEDVARAGKAVEYGLFDVAVKVNKVIESGAWRRYVTPMNREVTWPSFRKFVEGDRPDGLGTDVITIRKACRDHPKVLARVDRALQRPVGRPPADEGSPETVDIINDKPDGTSKAQALRRLRKDRPDLLAKVLAKELSPHAAAVEAGFRRRTITVPVDPEAAARTLRRHFDVERLIAELGRP